MDERVGERFTSLRRSLPYLLMEGGPARKIGLRTPGVPWAFPFRSRGMPCGQPWPRRLRLPGERWRRLMTLAGVWQ